jgi:hypothetical protein
LKAKPSGFIKYIYSCRDENLCSYFFAANA